MEEGGGEEGRTGGKGGRNACLAYLCTSSELLSAMVLVLERRLVLVVVVMPEAVCVCRCGWVSQSKV